MMFYLLDEVDEVAAAQSLYTMLFTIFLIATFVVVALLGVLVTFKKFVKPSIPLASVSGAQPLDGNEATYFAFIKYDEASRSIVLRQANSFSKCVVSLITANNGKRKIRRHVVEFNGGDNIAAIKVNEPINEYLVVLESVDKNLQKHQALDINFILAIVAALLALALFAGFGVFYVMLCSTFLVDEWPEFATYYALPAFGLIGVALIIGGYWFTDFILRKGGF